MLTPVDFILIAFWSSGPGLRSQWCTLAHFLEKCPKNVTNGSPRGTIFLTRGPYFDTRGLYFGSFVDFRSRPAEPVGHFGSLAGKRNEKGHKSKSNWSSKWDGFCICSIILLLCGCYCGSLAETGFRAFFVTVCVGVRRAEYGFDHCFYCAKRTSYV